MKKRKIIFCVKLLADRSIVPVHGGLRCEDSVPTALHRRVQPSAASARPCR